MKEPKNTDHTIQYYRDMIQYNLDVCCYTGVIIYAHKIQKCLKEEEAAKDITDYFHKDWKKYLESEEGKKYLEEINKNYDNFLDGKE